jgi:hypothetical protein
MGFKVNPAYASYLTTHVRIYVGPLEFEAEYQTACGEIPVWYMAGTGGNQVLVPRDLRAAVVVTRMAYKLRGTSIQTVEMLEKYILAALPCAKN